ncbi:MarR family transcriptional regulator, partial [Kocuria oceani]
MAGPFPDWLVTVTYYRSSSTVGPDRRPLFLVRRATAPAPGRSRQQRRRPSVQSSHLREHNLSTVLRAVAGAGEPVSRAALAKSTGLTKPTVSKLVQELLDAGLLVEGRQ